MTLASREFPAAMNGFNEAMEPLLTQIGRVLMIRDWHLATAESCTGGRIAQLITAQPGASRYYDRGFVTYSNRAKTEQLGVAAHLIATEGAVSAAVARQMAEGARRAAGVEVAVAVTGIAGPTGGSPEKPVGTVYVAAAGPAGTVVKRCRLHGSRGEIQARSAAAALDLLWSLLRP